MVLSTPLKIAAGATALGAVGVIIVIGVGLENATSSRVAVDQTAPQVVIEQPADPNVAEGSETATAVAASKDGPTFDLVRVDEAGAAVIAGSAAPQSDVAIMVSGSVLETVQADNNGAFVALVQLPAAEQALTVGLQQLRDGDVVAVSVQTVLVAPPAVSVDDSAAPTIVLADDSGAEVLQGGAQSFPQDNEVAVANPLSLDTISYDNSGAVVLSGQGTGAQFVRIYVDNEPIETELVPNDGKWRVVLPDVDQGVYTLRVDEINDVGKVQARVESPFQRVAATDVATEGVALADTGRVIVQPGHTLWALAETTYGDGEQYVQIFHANRDSIRDANLIYPGQIFELPE